MQPVPNAILLQPEGKGLAQMQENGTMWPLNSSRQQL